MSENEPLTLRSADETRVYATDEGYVCIEQEDGLGNSDRVLITVDRIEQLVAFLRQTADSIRNAEAQSPEALAIANYAGK